ncbi:hypothetical protein Val02_52310 [Virgisporangium aliadipatigenens]|uniref:Uncharacterized protein n=1 Tax=Virgisporangium aliadipatigenens TaxID=741659 RepID=A0A8J3YQW6_9ACTN|nr:hypothetical protein Val02_52310 [Virgisporangium aliadipatigenens]
MVLTLPTRPCGWVGTARCRTVTAVVARTNSCTPKTNTIAPATQGEAMSADGVQAEASRGVAHEHRPGRAEPEVEHEDRQRRRAHRRVADRPAHALDDVALHAAPFDRLDRGQRDARHEQHRRADEHRLGQERPRPPGREQHRADRRPGEAVERDDAGLDAGVRGGEVVPAHQHRREGARGVVGEDLGRPEQAQRQQHQPVRLGAGEQRRDEADEDHGADGVRGEDDAPAVEAVREGTRVQAEDQRWRPAQQRGRRHHERVRRQRGDEQRTCRPGDASRRCSACGPGQVVPNSFSFFSRTAETDSLDRINIRANG